MVTPRAGLDHNDEDEINARRVDGWSRHETRRQQSCILAHPPPPSLARPAETAHRLREAPCHTETPTPPNTVLNVSTRYEPQGPHSWWDKQAALGYQSSLVQHRMRLATDQMSSWVVPMTGYLSKYRISYIKISLIFFVHLHSE